MCEILASVIGRRLERLVSDEGTALGAAVVALAGMESHRRGHYDIEEPFTVADAVKSIVQFREPVEPVVEWGATYANGLANFAQRIAGMDLSGYKVG
jgi:sugar (pentulose or hexulose) kinase